MRQPHDRMSTEWFFHQILKIVGGVVGVIRISFQSNSNSQKLSLWCKKKIIVDLMKDLKYEHQSIFPLLGRVKLNFRDR